MAQRLNPWAPPTIRFWIWWNDGPVKITVEPGQTVTAYRWSRCDEGWSSLLESFEHDGDSIVAETITDGRDCDGRLTQSWKGYAQLATLRRYPLRRFVTRLDEPWREQCEIPYEQDGFDCETLSFREGKRSQRDEYADVAGY